MPPIITVRLKTLILTMILMGCTIEMGTLWFEKTELKNVVKSDSSRIDIQSAKYTLSKVNGQQITSLLKYSITFIFVYFFRPITRYFKGKYVFTAVLFFVYRFVIAFISQYYQIFVTDQIFKFNIFKIEDFFINFVIFLLIDGCLYVAFIKFSSLFNQNKAINKFVADKPDVDEPLAISGETLDNLGEIGIGSSDSSDKEESNVFQRPHWGFPLATFIILSILVFIRTISVQYIQNDYLYYIPSEKITFNESVAAFTLTDAPYFQKHVRYGVSKKTLHSEMKTVGLFKPILIFSMNNFYYATPYEISALGPVARSMLESHDNMIQLCLNISRALIYSVLLYGICKAGIDDFVTRSTNDTVVKLFLAGVIYLTVGAVFTVFVNGVRVNAALRHECASFKVGFPISAVMTKLARRDLMEYTPTPAYRLMYVDVPTPEDRSNYATICKK